jgi:hypothetical protein
LNIFFGLFISYSFYSGLHYCLFFEDTIRKFYKGAKDLQLRTPDRLEQAGNILFAILTGSATTIFMLKIIDFIMPSLIFPLNYGISFLFGISYFIPLILRHKRVVFFSLNPFE